MRITVPGHTQRGGSPCPYDRVLSTRLGAEAATLIMKKEYGYMVGIINGKVKKVPLGDVAGKLKMVSPDDQLIKKQNASASALVYKTETVSDGSHFTSM